MATEPTIQFRQVVETTADTAHARWQYRTRSVETGVIALLPALVGLSAWSAWTYIDADTVVVNI